ncbi:prepilin peptidase dependent protein D [Orbus hercynius]|uniref:Prepilin peptidase dependent protein D n=1 Tax=Orbus hercynius TaxID=593135 RepID=A0A495RH37_9GAMM|nr:prepilin peptidase-dependent pilin [Orbus hercynius]RKS86843.1 prepilin peptidase dependent protein D [Orbus hercynius]
MPISANHVPSQGGFTLFELMIAIAVIAILTAIGVPAYQGYVQKAAMTDMLQTMVPYKTSIEICALQQGHLADCDSGNNGIPLTKTTYYVAAISVSAGVITLVGQGALTGLTTTLKPTINTVHGHLDWQKNCITTPINTSLNDACNAVFRFE